MVLVLVVHSLEAVSATVPICMIALKEAVDRRALPEDLKIRQVVPTGGLRCVSLWDVTDKDALQAWMEENLGPDVKHEILDVAEDFTYGLAAELQRIRTAEKIAAQSRKTAGTVAEKTKATFRAAGHKLEELDTKWKVSENTTAAFQTAKETGAAVFTRIGSSVTQTKEKALENPKVAATANTIGTGLQTGWKRIGVGFESARGQVSRLLGGGHNLRRTASSGDAPTMPRPDHEGLDGAAAESKSPAKGDSSAPAKDALPGGKEGKGDGVNGPQPAVDDGAVFSLGDEGDDVTPRTNPPATS
ncbi:unnamed protein product [Ostreobium quekettii]|uniref:Senescence domain-containing protein n=1 Tax=Ostreobium quekettii TaxID=121088 RepID=A0A8S1J613_9CHLO|nr:unnamed protein product [Ostreobium quekettii]|eukprot:evm.model.scf_1682.1 EVM.evm.TU.scf_1682.1   scf_1682:8433-16573(-)